MATAFKDGRLAFSLGEDYAHHGLLQPDGVNKDFEQGYTYRLQQNKPQVPADRFIRKWLQIRHNAWKRNRLFSPDVTPDFLRSIDTATCPVSAVALTYGTGLDTDWSVDRIDNEGAYATVNLIICSTRVNTIKGALSAQAIVEISLGKHGKEYLGLNIAEWERIALLCTCAGADNGFEYPVRAVLPPSMRHPHLVTPWCYFIQDTMVRTTTLSQNRMNMIWLEWEKATPAESLVYFKVVRKEIESYALATYAKHREVTKAFSSDNLWKNFAAWWMALSDAGTLMPLLYRYSDKLYAAHARDVLCNDDMQEQKHTATKGYA